MPLINQHIVKFVAASTAVLGLMLANGNEIRAADTQGGEAVGATHEFEGISSNTSVISDSNVNSQENQQEIKDGATQSSIEQAESKNQPLLGI